jgi:dTDP-4-amino-4,6-dideoxygalactose transaminase/predicted GNAT family N-acyltransferase
MISLFKVFMSPEASQLASTTLNSGMITQGPRVEEFEAQLREYFNHPYILTLNSATSGLTLALRLLDLPIGSEVLSCPLTCTATNWPILANNHTIKWVDVDKERCNMSLTDLRNKISANTRAIMLVHWAGIPNDLDAINKILDEAEAKYGHRIKVVEDCAHSFGSKYHDKFIGTHGNIAVFSLQAIKHLTTVDGGLIFLPNEAMYRRAKLLRWFGIDREIRSKGDFRMEPDVPEWGYKFHMNDVNASIGLANLPHMNHNITRIREVADKYYEEFKNLRNVELLTIPDNCKPAWWIFTFKVKKGLNHFNNRDNFIKYCNNKGIMASMVHKRNDVHSCVSEFKIELPNLDELESEYVSIPCGWWLSDEDVDKIIRTVKGWDIICNTVIRSVTTEDYYGDFLQLFQQLNGVEIKMTKDEFDTRVNNLFDSSSEVLVVEYTGKIIATAKYFIEHKFYDDVAHIQDVICDESFRRYGIASYLLRDIIDRIKKYHKVYKIILSAQDKNEAFYSSLGFVTDSKEYKIYITN